VTETHRTAQSCKGRGLLQPRPKQHHMYMQVGTSTYHMCIYMYACLCMYTPCIVPSCPGARHFTSHGDIHSPTL